MNPQAQNTQTPRPTLDQIFSAESANSKESRPSLDSIFANPTDLSVHETPAPQSLEDKLKEGDTGFVSGLGSRIGAEQVAGAKKVAGSIEKGSEDIAKGGVGNVIKGAAEAGFGGIAGTAQAAFAPVTAVAGPVLSKATPASLEALRLNHPILAQAFDAVAPVIQEKILPKIQELMAKHPDATSLTSDIASTILLALGGGEAEAPLKDALTKEGFQAAKESISKAPEDIASAAASASTKLAERSAQKETQAVLDLVSPKMTKKETEAAIAAGRGEKSGPLGRVKVKPDARTLKAAESVKGIVDPKKTIVENINATKEAIGKEAEALKANIKAVDKPYDINQLETKLNGLEKPISIKSDVKLDKQFDLVRDAAIKLAKEKGGNVSDLLDARKALDDLVDKELPNLYDKENAPMRDAVISMRRAINEFIDANLPEGTGFKESLAKQSSMYDALDGMNTKSAEEVGGNIITRTAKKYPTATKVAKYGAAAVLGGGIAREILP